MASKKIMGILLSLALVLSMTACSKSEETTKKSKKEKDEQEEVEDEDEDEDDEDDDEDVTSDEDPDDTEDTEASDESSSDGWDGIVDPDASIAQSNMIPGIMWVIGGSNDTFVDGVCLLSPTSGTPAMQAKSFRQVFIRCMFENTDHIEIYLAPSVPDTLTAYLVPHHNYADYYTEEYVEALPDEVVRTELTDPNDPDWYWGDISINPDVYVSGYYDLLFVEDGAPVSFITLKIKDNGFIDNYSDDQYYAMLKEECDNYGMSDAYKVDFGRFYGCLEQGIWPDEYTWSGSGLPTLPSDSEEADITLNKEETYVKIVSKLVSSDEESACQAIDDVLRENGYDITYPDGDSDANYRYVYVDIDGVPCEISYWGYNGELNLSITNLIANA
ncbi:MAG: hypothetical protein IK020_11320 [Clostridiales bacterium]|nr:hypothetical protein [Clostridiales bacterium]